MELFYLDESSYKRITYKPIYIVGYYKKCLSDLCDSFSVLPCITGIVDDMLYESYRSCVFRDKVIPILSISDLHDILEDAVIIILGNNYRRKYWEIIDSHQIADKIDRMYFFPGAEGHFTEFYYQKYSQLKNVIVFRSGLMATSNVKEWEFVDNSRALFEYMISHGYTRKYTLVWLEKNPAMHEHRYQGMPNVVFLPYDGAWTDDEEIRDKYYRYLCSAKFVFFSTNCTFARNLRDEQIRINLWHGCGFKAEKIRIERHWYEIMTVTSDMYANLHAKQFGLLPEQMLITGLPKNDWVFHPAADWKARLRIPQANHYIFWLPTYRKEKGIGSVYEKYESYHETGLPIFASESQLYEFNEVLASLNIVVVIKLHPLQDRSFVNAQVLSNIVIIDNDLMLHEVIDINEILYYADALVSDYSSVATGFMLLDRPIAFTLDDIDFYNENRGFHWPKEELRNWLPGEELFTYDDFVQFVQNVADGRDNSKAKRQRLMPYFHKYTDGNSCARVLEALGITKDLAVGTAEK